MKIDRNTPIAGLRPAVLKRLFQREEFGTDTFAMATGVGDAAAKLRELVDLGWLEQHGDWWRITEMGARLAAASLLAPLTVVRARELARGVVAAAEAVNHDPTFSQLVSRLVLFGSLMDASPGGTVGDVDIAFEVVRREHDEDKHEALHQAELEIAPAGVPVWYWGYERAVRRLRKRQVNLHSMLDFDTIQAPGLTLYRWDREAGRGASTMPW